MNRVITKPTSWIYGVDRHYTGMDFYLPSGFNLEEIVYIRYPFVVHMFG